MFRGSQLCIPRCSMRDNLLEERHGGGLDGHFGQDKAYAQLSSFYYWPGMRTNVKKYVEKCRICQYAKGRSENARLSQPFPIPSRPWDVVSIKFVLGFPRTQRGHDSILVVVDRFSKMTHFLPSFKTSDAMYVTIFFQISGKIT